MKSLFYAMLFGLVLGFVIFIFKSGIIYDTIRGYNIVQQINKGSLKTITIEEYKNLTRYKRYIHSFGDYESDEVQELFDKLEKQYGHDGPTMECLHYPSRCD